MIDTHMAKKRVIITHEREEEPITQTDETIGDASLPARDTGWKSWFRSTYLKYWYVAGCLFVDVIISLEVSRIYEGGTALAVAILLFLLLIVVEGYAYQRIWGKRKR